MAIEPLDKQLRLSAVTALSRIFQQRPEVPLAVSGRCHASRRHESSKKRNQVKMKRKEKKRKETDETRETGPFRKDGFRQGGWSPMVTLRQHLNSHFPDRVNESLDSAEGVLGSCGLER